MIGEFKKEEDLLNEEKMEITPEKYPHARDLNNDEQRKIFTIGDRFVVRPDAEDFTKDWKYVMSNNIGKIVTIKELSTVGEEYGKKRWMGYDESQADDLIIKGKKDWWHYKALYHPDMYDNIKKSNILMWKTEPITNRDDDWFTDALDDDGNVVYKLTYKDDKKITHLFDVRKDVKYTIPDAPNANSGYISRNKGYALADKLNDYFNKLPF